MSSTGSPRSGSTSDGGYDGAGGYGVAGVTRSRRHRSAAAVVVLLVGLSLLLGAAPAQAAVDLRDPFTRETVQRGDVDRDQYNIEHVYEVQIRLRRLGLLRATPNGVFGPQTAEAVKRFQRQIKVRPTGIVGPTTWPKLINRSIRGRAALPRACTSAGWHVCYDRTNHQASLFVNGRMHNSWLVRGGGASTPTRTGNFVVGWRSKDHRSNQYDGAPMPYSQFFSGGQALHGSRNMMNPYVGHSHGCVNFWVEDARQLWNLTSTKRLAVHVYGAWH